MRYLVSCCLLVLAFQGDAAAQVGPVEVFSDLGSLPSIVILIAPDQPARVFAGGVPQSTDVEVSVEWYTDDEIWWCDMPGGLLSGVTHLSLGCDQSGAVFVGAPYPMLEPTDAQGVGRFDVASLRGGGHTAPGELRFLVPDRGSCGMDFNGRIASPDLTGDLVLNLADLSVFTGDYQTYHQRSDFNGDGALNLGDVYLFAAYFLSRG